MFERILVVCTGNVCRSPIAEQLLAQQLPGKQVSSAGTHALKNSDIYSSAKNTAEQKHGVSLKPHQSRQITTDIIQQSDLILVMENKHRHSIEKIDPSALGKVFLLGKWNGNKEIPDPIGKSDEVFNHVHQLIADSVQQWVTALNH